MRQKPRTFAGLYVDSDQDPLVAHCFVLHDLRVWQGQFVRIVVRETPFMTNSTKKND